MDCLAFPIKFDSTGVSKLTENSTDYFRQLLSVIVRTEPNILPMTPDLGVYDPAFRDIDMTSFVQQAARYAPEVTIEDVDVNIDNDGAVDVSFSFTLR